MKHLLVILLGCLLPALLPAVETFSVLDFEGEGLNRGRNTFNAETFPHCKPTAAENTNGFRLTAVDMNVNIRKAFQWERPQLDKEIRMLTCRDEHTFGLFTVFALKETGKFEISVSDLTGDNGVIPASQLKVLEMIPKGANPRFTYSRSILKPQLENVKAGEMLELLVMVNVDKDVKGGLYRGKLTVRSSNGSQEEMAISLRVAPFILGEYGHFGFYLNGNLYANKPYFNINQKAYVKENLPLYCNFLKSRRFNSLTIYDCLPDLRFVNGKVTGTFDDMSALALAMKRSGMGGMLIIDLRDIGYWCNAVALKLESLGGKAPAGDIGITMQQRRSSTEGYPDKAKELYGEAIKLLMRQAAAEDWPEIRLLADEELGNQFPLKISNYENYMPVIMKVAPELGAVVDNGIGWGRKTCTEYADRDNVKHRQYNSWTDESLAEAKRDGAEVFTFNYSVARINSGFTQIRMNSLGHHQWADLWDASNYQWQMNRLSTAGVVTCLASERMHEGIVDYSACRLLQDLVAKCRTKGLNELAEMGEKTLKDVTADLSVNHNTAQLQGYLMSGANLDARRWEVFCAIAKILDFTGMTGDDRIAAGTTTLTVRKAIRPQPKKTNFLHKLVNRSESDITPEGAPSEKFWGSGIGPLTYLTEHETKLRARASDEEDFKRLNQPTHTVVHMASLTKGLAIYSYCNHVQPKNPYRFERTDDDGDMWQDDCMEFFFTLPNKTSIHLLYNAAGAKTFIRSGVVIPAKDIQSYVLSPINKSGGTINKLLIPWSYFGLKSQPLPGTVWDFNVGRECHTLQAILSWGRVATSFHESDKWGQVLFTNAGGSNYQIKPSITLEGNPNKQITSGDTVIFSLESRSSQENLKLKAELIAQDGKKIALPDMNLPVGAAEILLDTRGMSTGKWKLQLWLDGSHPAPANSAEFILLPSPWK